MRFTLFSSFSFPPLLPAGAVAAGLLLSWVASPAMAQGVRKPLPAPYATPSASNAAKVTPKPEGAKLTAPAGFVVEEFASGFERPRTMLELPSGVILVVDSTPKGTIHALQLDKSKKPLLQNLERPFGLALNKGYLYVSEAQAIKRYKFNDKTLEIGPAEKVVALDGYTKGHWSRAIAFDKKTGKMYVSVGSGSNVDLGDPANRAAINVYDADGSNGQILAGGLRNPVWIAFHPKSNKLWTTVQERDGLGDDLVPDFFTEVKQGAFYGWPYAYVGPNEEPRNKGANPELVKKTIEPDVLLPAHCAVMGFSFYTGKMFPAKYREGAFLAYHGSNNKSVRIGYNVVFVPFKNGRPAGDPEEFVTGWMMGPDKKEVWGRPVGVAQLKDGSLLVSEDGNNKIYRISYKK